MVDATSMRPPISPAAVDRVRPSAECESAAGFYVPTFGAAPDCQNGHGMPSQRCTKPRRQIVLRQVAAQQQAGAAAAGKTGSAMRGVPGGLHAAAVGTFSGLRHTVKRT